MKRQIIEIDQDKCNGCGACAEACHEGAIAMVDGKAQLMRDDYCDGLGDVFELLAWNQGIGFFSSEIGPSALFQAYKLIKNGEKQGKSRRIPAVRCARNLGRKPGDAGPEQMIRSCFVL